MKKIGILCVLVLLFFYNTSYPASAQELKHALSGSQGLMISESHGTIRDSYFTANNRGIIVHIQDLHCNYDAQMSIYNIISELIDRYGLDLVTVEGSVGRLETAPFSSYPDKEIKEQVAKYFIKTGELDGAALAHIMQESGFTFWGVDDPKVHADNVSAFKVSLEAKSASGLYYDNIKSILEKFKSKLYSKELKELDEKIEGYKKEEIDFSEYIAYLKTLSGKHGLDLKDYPNFTRLTEVLKKEADINFVEVDTQRSKYIDRLNKELDKDGLTELLDKSLYFKLGKVPAVSFYSYLKEISETEDISLKEDYPQLEKYIQYIRLYSSINNIALFKEVEAIENNLKEKLFASDAERKIDTLSYTLDILNDLFNLKLTKGTLQYYREHRKEFATANFINFISKNAPKYNIRYKLDPSFRQIDEQLPGLERFYNLAEERDAILVDNTLRKMQEQRTDLCVLVSGGFHTDGITKILKERGLSYVVITPKVNSLQEDNPYVSALLGEKNESDRFYDAVMESRKKGAE